MAVKLRANGFKNIYQYQRNVVIDNIKSVKMLRLYDFIYKWHWLSSRQTNLILINDIFIFLEGV